MANKIDVDYNVTRKEFKFAAKHNLPFFFVSAADGTNVVKVFQSAILEAKRFKESGGDFLPNNWAVALVEPARAAMQTIVASQ